MASNTTQFISHDPSKLSGYIDRTRNRDIVYGYVADPNATNVYTVNVTSTKVGKVRALLQDKFSMRATSEWATFSSVGKLQDYVSEVMALGGVSPYNQFISRRLWKGSSPLALSLTLKFMAVKDAYTEVLIPTIMLLQMALPSIPAKNTADTKVATAQNLINSFLIVPPGPNPFAENWASEIINDTFKNVFATRNPLIKDGDLITVKIGNYMSFSNVIVKDVVLETPKKFNNMGIPVESTVTLEFETYEVQTKEDMVSSFDPYINSMINQDKIQNEKHKELMRANTMAKEWVGEQPLLP